MSVTWITYKEWFTINSFQLVIPLHTKPIHITSTQVSLESEHTRDRYICTSVRGPVNGSTRGTKSCSNVFRSTEKEWIKYIVIWCKGVKYCAVLKHCSAALLYFLWLFMNFMHLPLLGYCAMVRNNIITMNFITFFEEKVPLVWKNIIQVETFPSTDLDWQSWQDQLESRWGRSGRPWYCQQELKSSHTKRKILYTKSAV